MKIQFLTLLIIATFVQSVDRREDRPKALDVRDVLEEPVDQRVENFVLNPHARLFQPVLNSERLTNIAHSMCFLPAYENKFGEYVATNENNVRAIYDEYGLSYLAIAGLKLDPVLERGVSRDGVDYHVANSCRGGQRLIELIRIDE